MGAAGAAIWTVTACGLRLGAHTLNACGGGTDGGRRLLPTWAGEMDHFEEDAYVELNFSPNVRLVGTVRRFVSEFYAQVIGDGEIISRLAVATHELLENAVRYSLDGNTTARVSVKNEPGAFLVTIDTKNRAAEEKIGTVRKALDDLAKAEDAEKYYQTLMRASAKRTDGSGLGFGRVRAESGMPVTYEVVDDVIHVRARARFEAGGKR